jgi:hypothetical protein
MSKALPLKFVWAGAASLLFTPLVGAEAVFPFDSQLTLSDPCAVFNAPTIDPNITRITYGEDIDFNLSGQSQAIIDVDGLGKVHLKFQVTTHGDGIGQTSGIKYLFKSKVMVKSNTDGYDPLGLDPLDEGFVYTGSFVADARIIGQGSAGDAGGIAQGAQDNAQLRFKLGLHYANGEVRNSTSDFTLTCAASPWANLMQSKQAGTKTPVGRGFGDVWNKYAWAMKDFNGGMLVGTKNAYFDTLTALTIDDGPLAECNQAIGGFGVPSLYTGLACMELFASSNNGQAGAAAANTRFAQIWRFDYVKKTWTKVNEEPYDGGQGYRNMQVHNGKLYAASDLGSFIMGVRLGSLSMGATPLESTWDFPSSALLVSTTGTDWTEVSCGGQGTPCNPAWDATLMEAAIVNVSFRALESFDGKIYVGTFNYSGGELWSYDDNGDSWARVAKFAEESSPICAYPSPWYQKCTGTYSTGLTELQVYGNKLLIGIGTNGVGNEYLWYLNDSGGDVTLVPSLPGTGEGVNPTALGVLKLFLNSRNQLFVSLFDIEEGFTLLRFDGSVGGLPTEWELVSNNGFFNRNNAYVWSMAEINGRTFIGTFNQDFLVTVPRGSSELWYSDDGRNWQQMALPLDWGLWNYGIREMEVANKMLFLGTASNMIAPGLTVLGDGTFLSPGAEVWTIRSTVVAPTGKKK